MRVSLRHVAERAGVSRVTASNVLRGKASEVSEATQLRVLEVMRALNYMPVPPPSRQRSHAPTRIIGLLFDYIELDDQWGLRVYRGLRDGARETGYDLLSLVRDMPANLLDRDISFLDRRSDGFIFVAPRDRQSALRTLAEHAIPVVVCCAYEVPVGVATVNVDDCNAMALAVRHLVAAGHRRIIHLAGPQSRDDFRARRHGYEDTMRACGLSPHVIATDGLVENVWQSEVWPAIERGQCTAIACANDSYALDIWRLAPGRGIAVPEQLSLTGMDDLAAAEARGLSTIAFSSAAVGEAAARTLAALITHQEVTLSQVVPVWLIERGSVAPPRYAPV